MRSDDFKALADIDTDLQDTDTDLQDIEKNLHLHKNTKLLGSGEELSATKIYKILKSDYQSIDTKLYYLEKLLNIFEESKYWRAHGAGNVAGKMGMRYIDTGNSDNDDKPITLKASGYAIRAISYTMTALKALKETDGQKANSIIDSLITNHEFLARPETIQKFKDTTNDKIQKEISTQAQNKLYDFIEQIAFIATENGINKKEAAKKLRRNDDYQLIRRPEVRSTVELENNITVTQIFTPVIRMTKKQKEEWRKVKNDADPEWFIHLTEEAKAEYRQMAQDAFALEGIRESDFNSSDLKSFKKAVSESENISNRMKLIVENDLDEESFKNFDPFFLLAQAASSSNRSTPQASNFVQIQTITKKDGKVIRQDISYTRSTEAMLDHPTYKKESNYIPQVQDKSPFWQKNYTLFPNFLQKLPNEDDAKELVKYTTMTMEQIYYNNIANSENPNDITDLSRKLDMEFLKHWNINVKEDKTLDKPLAVQIKNKVFKHEPILFSSSLLTALPGVVENNMLVGKVYADRNRMMIQHKLAAFDELKGRKDICGKMITMNFATNNIKKLSLMGFDNSVDMHNKKAAVELTLAVLKNLVVATKVYDKVNSLGQSQNIPDKLADIYLDIEKSLNNGSYKIKPQIIKTLTELEKSIEEKPGKPTANVKIAIAATSAFLQAFKQRNTPKSANEQVMMACYANLMVQNSSGPASQTDQHCKSGRDRTFVTQLHEEAMKGYFAVYNKLPSPDDKGEDRENFIKIFEKFFFQGAAQENSNQNQHGSFGLQNLTVRNGWPLCLALGTINPDETCLLANDIRKALEKRDPHLHNNDDLRHIGKMARKVKMNKKTSIKKTTAKSIALVALSPLFLCCKITGKIMPQYNPIFTGVILFTLATVGAVYLSPLIIAAAPIVQISAIAGASLLFAIGSNGLDPDKKMAEKRQDIISIALITVGISIILLNPVAIAAIGISAMSLPIVIGIAAITATFATNITKAFIPQKDISPTIDTKEQSAITHSAIHQANYYERTISQQLEESSSRESSSSTRSSGSSVTSFFRKEGGDMEEDNGSVDNLSL